MNGTPDTQAVPIPVTSGMVKTWCNNDLTNPNLVIIPATVPGHPPWNIVLQILPKHETIKLHGL